MPPKEDATPAKKLPSVGKDYKLVSKLGEGAFGEVYLAHHELLGQDFAVKILKPELCEDQDVRDRFLDEARALIRFSHPNVVQMRHVGEHNNRLFLVMDFVKGDELYDVIKREAPFSEERALSIMTQMLAGLEAAHAGGIVHRDLKPANIILEKRDDGSERVRILDFGLSKFSLIDGEAGAHRSITGTIVGTLAYMSPEQIKGDPDIDGRSDLFAAGLILQEMLQGHHPYPGESGIVVAAKLLRDPIPPLKGKPATVISDGTKSALARAVERDRDARFTSVTAFAQALEGRGPPSDTSRIATVAEAQQELARQEAAARKQAGAGAQKKKPTALIGLVAVLVAAAGWYFLLGPGSKGTDEPTTKTATGDVPPKGGTGNGMGHGSSVSEDPTPDTPTPPVVPENPDADPDVAPDPAGTGTDNPPGGDPQPDPTPEPAPFPDPAPPGDPASSHPTPPGSVETPPVGPDPIGPGPGADPALSPKDCCQKAAPLFAAGDWPAARALFLQTTATAELTDDLQIAALRGAAESWIAEADGLARSGSIEQALSELDQAVAWLQERHAAYERVEHAVDRTRLQMGFSRMHEAEAHVERARWLRVLGKGEEAETELKQAAIGYDFALQQLNRDGVRFWEFLIRRAELHRLERATEAMLKDVAHTTKTNNTEVPPHMWVAHARTARQVAQAYAAKGNATEALGWARKAAKVAEDGVGWQDVNLTRQQWLDMARVLFVLSTLQAAGDDPTALHGKTRYWVSEAEKKKPAAWVDAKVAKAKLLTGQAMERNMQGLVYRKRGKAEPAAKAFAEAEAMVAEAIKLRQEVEAAGGLKADGLSFEVQAAVAKALGKEQEAATSLASASRAAATNPD